ncbi:hypothetical protein Hanom_Chr01g00019571 [Helianthus anomalus]
MTIKVKPHGSRFKKFEIWTKMTKVSKPQEPKWQFTLYVLNNFFTTLNLNILLYFKN